MKLCCHCSGQLRGLVVHMISPALRYSPPAFLGSGFGDEIAQVLGTVYGHLRRHWSERIVSQESCSGTLDNREEIERERSLRELTRAVLGLVNCMLGVPPNEGSIHAACLCNLIALQRCSWTVGMQRSELRSGGTTI